MVCLVFSVAVVILVKEFMPVIVNEPIQRTRGYLAVSVPQLSSIATSHRRDLNSVAQLSSKRIPFQLSYVPCVQPI